jgi:hypothetical protein
LIEIIHLYLKIVNTIGIANLIAAHKTHHIILYKQLLKKVSILISNINVSLSSCIQMSFVCYLIDSSNNERLEWKKQQITKDEIKENFPGATGALHRFNHETGSKEILAATEGTFALNNNESYIVVIPKGTSTIFFNTA